MSERVQSVLVIACPLARIMLSVLGAHQKLASMSSETQSAAPFGSL